MEDGVTQIYVAQHSSTFWYVLWVSFSSKRSQLTWIQIFWRNCTSLGLCAGLENIFLCRIRSRIQRRRIENTRLPFHDGRLIHSPAGNEKYSRAKNSNTTTVAPGLVWVSMGFLLNEQFLLPSFRFQNLIFSVRRVTLPTSIHFKV